MTDRTLVGAHVPGALPEPPATPEPAPRGRRTLLARLALALGSGLLLTLAFPGVDVWPLAPVAVAGLTLACRGTTPGRAALLGLVAGLAFFVPHLHWSGIYVGALPWFALAGVESVYVALMAAALPLAWRAPFGPAGTSVAVAGLWVAQEAVRGRWPFGGFPWGRLAFSQADAPTAGLAALGGVPLVSFAVAATGALLACAVVGAFAARRRVLAAGGALVAAVAVLLAGTAVPRPTEGPTTRVAAVQGNVPRAGLEFNAERRAVLDNHAKATLALADRVRSGAAPRPDLVVWPENSSDIDPLQNPDAAAAIDAAVSAIGVPVLVGAVLDGPGRYLSNASIVWSPGSGPGERYVKQHPAPFGEYIPYRDFFRTFSDKVDLVGRDFVAGTNEGTLTVGGLRLADVICFEVAYDGLVREPVAAGARLIVVQTNNATFGRSAESVQQLAMSRLRAVESGRSVVHVSTVGISAMVLPDGKVVRRSGHFTQEVLEADVPLRTGRTLSTRLGEAPEWTLGGLGVVLAAIGALQRRHGRRRASRIAD